MNQRWMESYQKVEMAIKRESPDLFELVTKFLSARPIQQHWAEAPASTAVRFHHARAGGLRDHSQEVIGVMALVAQAIPSSGVSFTELYLAGLLHDIHKACDPVGRACFIPNILKSGKRSDAIPFQKNAALYNMARKDNDPAARFQEVLTSDYEYLPDGSLSLALIFAYAPELHAALSENVRSAIIFHDGAYGKARRNLAGHETPLQMLLHFADMWSSHSDTGAIPDAV